MILDSKLVSAFARGAASGQKTMAALVANMKVALGASPKYETAQEARAEVVTALEKAGYSAPARAWSRLLAAAEITPRLKDGTIPAKKRGPKAATKAATKAAPETATKAAPVADKKEAAPMQTEAAWQAADAKAVCAWLNKASRLTKAGQCDQLLIAAIRDLMAEFI